MLSHLGEDAAAADVDAAVDEVLAGGPSRQPAGTAEWEKALLTQLDGGGS
jgi:hypothetical protein